MKAILADNDVEGILAALVSNRRMPPPAAPRAHGRVDLGGCPPRSPTDPGLHITRTRFLIS